MRIFALALIVLLISNTGALARSASCDAACQDHKRGVAKPLRKHNDLVCIYFKQARRGSVVLTLIGGSGRSWQNTKKKRDKICIPIRLMEKARAFAVCGCKTPANPAGRWQRVNFRKKSDVRAIDRKEVLDLCRRN